MLPWFFSVSKVPLGQLEAPRAAEEAGEEKALLVLPWIFAAFTIVTQWHL
jgi:hypothetical protein